MGTSGRVIGTWDSGTQGLGRGDACMGGRGDVGRGDMGTTGGRDVGTRGCRDSRLGTQRHQDQGRGEVRNKRKHFLHRMNIKDNQRIKGRSLSEGPSEHRQTTFSLCGVFTVGT